MILCIWYSGKDRGIEFKIDQCFLTLMMGDKLTGTIQDNFGSGETVLVHNCVDRYITQSTCQKSQNYKPQRVCFTVCK